ncbi:MAG: hypothetical protein HKM89_14745 [Gemmatimonadales bacterium]|nr:hypothetical protein [Gemmatimonadales bacterium]
MLRNALPLTVVTLAVASANSCSGQARIAAAGDSVALAEVRYAPSTFDTVSWSTPASRLEEGRLVWRSCCAMCHGVSGAGDGDLAGARALEMPTLELDSIVCSGDICSIRHRIFIGSHGTMPMWGLHGLAYREIDAVSAFILECIRSDDVTVDQYRR